MVDRAVNGGVLVLTLKNTHRTYKKYPFFNTVCVAGILLLSALWCNVSYAVNADGVEVMCGWDADGIGQNHFVVEVQRFQHDGESDTLRIIKEYTQESTYQCYVENGYTYSVSITEVDSYGVRSDYSKALTFSVQDDAVTCLENGTSDEQASVALLSNYPNPFNPVTTISYTLPHDDHVTLSVYNVVGQEVVRLVEEYQPAGTYHATWQADRMSSGIYFYRIETSKSVETRKMMLVK